MNVGKARKQGHDLLQVYDEGGVVRSGGEAIEKWRTHLLGSWGVMIMRTPSWVTLIQGKAWIYQNVVSTCMNLSQGEVPWALNVVKKDAAPGLDGL